MTMLRTTRGKRTMKVRLAKKLPLSSAQAKAVAQVARRVTLKAAETKSPLNYLGALGTGQTINNDLVYATNLNYFISQGSSSEAAIGEKVYITNIHIKGAINAVNSASVGNNPSVFRLMIVRTKKALTNTTASITASDVFRSNGASLAYGSQGHVDMHKVDLLYDNQWVFETPNISQTDLTKVININLPVNKTHYFDADNSGYFKDKNYYMVFTIHRPDTSTPASIGYLRATWSVNFKDE